MVAKPDLGSGVARRESSSLSGVTMIIHFIWVGSGEIPQPFLSNLEEFKQTNPHEEILEWRDENLLPLLEKYGRRDLYNISSIFHKLQLARYTVLDEYGGLYTDYDVYWKKPILECIGDRINSDFSVIQRKSVYFYKAPQSWPKLRSQENQVVKTILLDDFVLFAKPWITNNFLNFSIGRALDPTRLKDNQTEPFSVYSLTEWVLSLNLNVQYFLPSEIYNDESCTLGYHDNKKSWEITQ